MGLLNVLCFVSIEQACHSLCSLAISGKRISDALLGHPPCSYLFCPLLSSAALLGTCDEDDTIDCTGTFTHFSGCCEIWEYYMPVTWANIRSSTPYR